MTNPTISIDLTRSIESQVGTGTINVLSEHNIVVNLADSSNSNPTINVDVSKVINIEIGNKTIDFSTGKTIEMNLVSVTTITANYVAQNIPFYLDGDGGTTFLKYNSTSELVELWVKGTKQAEWGAVEEDAGGDPFA